MYVRSLEKVTDLWGGGGGGGGGVCVGGVYGCMWV